MMDPYDTTDHNPDGYIIQSYERLAYGLLTWSDDGTTNTKFISAWPKEGWEYEPVMGEGMPLVKENVGNVADFSMDWDNAAIINNGAEFVEIEGMKIPYANTAADIKAFYPRTGIYNAATGLSGAAGVERTGDVAYSPYYAALDAYGTEPEVRAALGSRTLDILPNFQTTQQSTEWTCGPASALMVINHFGMNANDPVTGQLETDISLAKDREVKEGQEIGKTGVTHSYGMVEIFEDMEAANGQDWITFTHNEMGDLGGGYDYIDSGLIPYLIANDIPMMIGWDEWGGHWQVIIGYDDMGTPWATQDDVLILAEPYDTTDHNQNGYLLESYERLVYGWNTAFEDDETFVVAIPNTAEYADVIETLGLN
jgi:hypothetical protein